jgi:hypothetical protein
MTIDITDTVDEWINNVMEGFESELNDADGDVCLSCLADSFTNDNATALLDDALRLVKEDPEEALAYLNYKRQLYEATAQIINDMMVAVVDIHGLDKERV